MARLRDERSLLMGAAGDATSVAPSSRKHNGNSAERLRVLRKPKWRMRTKPVGRTCNRKRRKNSLTCSVMSRCLLWCAELSAPQPGCVQHHQKDPVKQRWCRIDPLCHLFRAEHLGEPKGLARIRCFGNGPWSPQRRCKEDRWTFEIARQVFDCLAIGAYRTLRVITALEFLEHHFSEMGHRDLLVTRHYPSFPTAA